MNKETVSADFTDYADGKAKVEESNAASVLPPIPKSAESEVQTGMDNSNYAFTKTANLLKEFRDK